MIPLFSEKRLPVFSRFSGSRLHARLSAACLVLSCLAALAACGPPPPSNPKVQAFVLQTRSDFDRLEKRLLPALQRPDPSPSADQALTAFFSDPQDRSQRTSMGIAVLGPHMKYLAGRRLDDSGATDAPIETRLTDFSYLKEIFKAASSKIAQSILHYPDQKIFAICGPVRRENRLLGFVCLFYRADRFEKDWGIGEEAFLAIDFGKR